MENLLEEGSSLFQSGHYEGISIRERCKALEDTYKSFTRKLEARRMQLNTCMEFHRLVVEVLTGGQQTKWFCNNNNDNNHNSHSNKNNYNNTTTEESRFNDLRFNDIPGITINIRFPGKSYSKMYGAEPRFNDIRFNDIPGLTMGILFPESKIFPGITIKPT